MSASWWDFHDSESSQGPALTGYLRHRPGSVIAGETKPGRRTGLFERGIVFYPDNLRVHGWAGMFSITRKSDRHAIGPLVYLFAVFSAVVTAGYLDMSSGEQTGHMLCPLPETGGNGA